MKKRSVVVPSAMATGGDDGTVFLDGKPSTSVPSRVLAAAPQKVVPLRHVNRSFVRRSRDAARLIHPVGKKWRAHCTSRV